MTIFILTFVYIVLWVVIGYIATGLFGEYSKLREKPLYLSFLAGYTVAIF